MTDIQETENSNSDYAEKKKKKPFTNKEEINEENCNFSEGQSLQFVKVRFPGHAKSYAFLVGKRNLVYGQKVMAMSDRGMAVGYINSFIYELPFKKEMLPLSYINKVATDDDIEKEKEVYKKQKEAENICHRLIEKHSLDMNLTHVEFTGFGKKVVFYFVAPARVDFRGLVKDLVSELRLRIELRQISVRDRAASQGALGPCGRELCCSSFLSKYGNVSIKMAKNQNLTLNYSKLNGVCGQLKCCLQYEDEVYTQKRKKMPEHGSFIKTMTGESGKVIKLNLLSQQFDLLTDKGMIKRFTSDQHAKTYKESDYNFPRRFDNISDETNTVIGLNEQEARKTRQFERDMEKMSKRAKKFAHETVEEISDLLPERDRSKDLSEDILNSKDEVEVCFEDLETESKQVSEKTNFDDDSSDKNTRNAGARGPRPRNNNRNQNKKNHHNKPRKNNKPRGPRPPKSGQNDGNKKENS